MSARALGCCVVLATLGCVSPPSVLAPTRTPKRHTLSAGLGLEYVAFAGDASRAERASPPQQPRALATPWLPRPRAWAMFALTDTLALSFATVVPPLAASLQAGVQWSPLRSRHFDGALLVRAGSEMCVEPVGLFREGSYCKSELAPGDLYAQGSAIALLGFNPVIWLTVQAQVGTWGRRGSAWRGGAWLGGNVLFLVSRHVAVGPDLVVLPGWFEDGRSLVQPSLSFVFWPQRDANPYR